VNHGRVPLMSKPDVGDGKSSVRPLFSVAGFAPRDAMLNLPMAKGMIKNKGLRTASDHLHD
jgi:hypothetical protein